MPRVQKLLFVDSNIFLDFYRARTDAGLKLLRHVEAISDRLISTYQVEMEVKKNRQAAIIEGLRELKAPGNIQRPGMFLDARANVSLDRSLKTAESRIKTMRTRLTRALNDPAGYDPVYQACQRLFHKEEGLVLTRNNPIRRLIRRLAFRRFIHGCPPRKSSDTSIGDAINWEWMIHCAVVRTAELVIVTRDSDYGLTYEGKSFINDHLRQEFAERVSNKRKLSLYYRLSDALRHFSVSVTDAEIREEERVVKTRPPRLIMSRSTTAPLSDAQVVTTTNFDQLLEELLGKGAIKSDDAAS